MKMADLRDLYTYQKTPEKPESEENYRPTVRDTKIFLENLIEKDPLVYDFEKDWWETVTDMFSDCIQMPVNRAKSLFSRLVPDDDEAFLYMISSDLELTMETASHVYGQRLLDFFDAKDWLNMTKTWEEDRELDRKERRYSSAIMNDYVTFFSADAMKKEMDEEMETMFDIFRKRLKERE